LIRISKFLPGHVSFEQAVYHCVGFDPGQVEFNSCVGTVPFARPLGLSWRAK
jgi:hypothetical protein